MSCCAVKKAETTERTAAVRPRVDILESSQEFLLVADMPGVQPGDVNLSFEKGELTLSGARGHSKYERTFAVSDVVAADRIAAEIKNGVLTVHLPKIEAVKPRKIVVQG